MNLAWYRRLWLGLAMIACAPARQDQEASTAADEAAIRRMITDYVAAVDAGDRARFLAFFAEDAVLMPPDEGAIRGRAAFDTFVTPLFEQFVAKEQFSAEEIRVVGDWAIVPNTYTLTLTPRGDGAVIEERGKGINIARRDSTNRWRWTHASWNRNEPPPR